MSVTSFRLKVGDAVHDDMVKEQGFVVDLDVSGEQATEVVHISEQGEGGDTVPVNQTGSNQQKFSWTQTGFFRFEPFVTS